MFEIIKCAYAVDIGERRVKFLLLAASVANKEKEPHKKFYQMHRDGLGEHNFDVQTHT